MEQLHQPKLDKTKITITSLTDEAEEKQYWLSRSPAERLIALEQQRRIIYGYDPSTTRLQRVLEITKRTRD
jgi:hypothetical protein